jgi:hypothetical protein
MGVVRVISKMYGKRGAVDALSRLWARCRRKTLKVEMVWIESAWNAADALTRNREIEIDKVRRSWEVVSADSVRQWEGKKGKGSISLKRSREFMGRKERKKDFMGTQRVENVNYRRNSKTRNEAKGEQQARARGWWKEKISGKKMIKYAPRRG